MSTPKKTKPLSKRARKMLDRIYDGIFYPAFDPKVGPVMKELLDAGLVTTSGRVSRIIRCFVPAKGFKGFKLDAMPEKPKWLRPAA